MQQEKVHFLTLRHPPVKQNNVNDKMHVITDTTCTDN